MIGNECDVGYSPSSLYRDLENLESYLDKYTDKNQESIPKKTGVLTEEKVADSQALVPVTDAVDDDDHLEKTTDDRTDKVADVNMENDVNKKVTKISKPTLRKTRKDAALSVEQEPVSIADNKKRKPTSSRSVKALDMEATETKVVKKKRKTKKDPALSVKEVTETKAVKKKRKTTSSRSVKALDMEAQKDNMEIPEDDRSTGNKQVLKSATEGSEKVTCKSDKADSEPKWFIFTGNSLQRREFQQLIRQLKGRVCEVSHQWSYQATHLIVPDPIKRTEKLFAAAASGRWILKTEYLTASNQAGKFLAEEPYEWHKNGLSEDSQIDLEAPRKWRLLKEKTGYGAFHGMRIVTYGECTTPSLDTLKRAVKAGDGTILATSPPYSRFLAKGIDFAVVSPGMSPVNIWVQWFLRCEIPCISANYLVEYVCKPGYPLDGHVKYGTNVLAERSYNNLKKRLDEEDNTGPRTPDSYDVACEVCGSHDRGEDMLICGDKSGSIGCGFGTHIDCCDPPLVDIPDDDWFCPKCTKAKNSMTKKSNKRKVGNYNPTKKCEVSQRKNRRLFTISEVEALVEAVEIFGLGRWSEVKKRAFDDADHRTSVDLKDKWKTLAHTASIPPQRRKGEAVPQRLLDRVLAAISLKRQSEPHSKHPPSAKKG